MPDIYEFRRAPFHLSRQIHFTHSISIPFWSKPYANFTIQFISFRIHLTSFCRSRMAFWWLYRGDFSSLFTAANAIRCVRCRSDRSSISSGYYLAGLQLYQRELWGRQTQTCNYFSGSAQIHKFICLRAMNCHNLLISVLKAYYYF